MAPDKERSLAAAAAGYQHGPPWVFKGSALYQLHLVKASTARAFVPPELRLVEAFGYTLGGMFLARYHDSPAGEFDELVVIAGIVWNPPTSCAWAARVLVNSVEACRHGRKEVGLPSHVATFSKTEADVLRSKPLVKPNKFLSVLGVGSTVSTQTEGPEIEISETKGLSTMHLCNISLPLTAAPGSSHKHHKWMGPAIRMSLPSFRLGKINRIASMICRKNPAKSIKLRSVIKKVNMSSRLCSFVLTEIKILVKIISFCTVKHGHDSAANFSGQTEDHPDLLKYSCQVECRVRPVKPARIWSSRASEPQEGSDGKISSAVSAFSDAQKQSVSVLLSKPIFALEFNSLRMHVDAPKIVVPEPDCKKKAVGISGTRV